MPKKRMFTPEQVREFRYQHEYEGKPVSRIAAISKCSESYMRDILNYRAYADVQDD